MRIGIAYDTPEMYNLQSDRIYFDFAEQASIDEVKESLIECGYKAELVGNAKRILELIKANRFDYDIVYNTVEGIGTRNREGLVPAILEAYNIPYTGTDSFGLSLTLNKMITKLLAERIGISTPPYYFAKSSDTYQDIVEGISTLHMPVILKPNLEGNSSGICVKDNALDAARCVLELIGKYQTDILCEEFIRGTEITVPMIGNGDEIVSVATTVDIQKNEDFWLDINCKVFGDYKNVIIEDKGLSFALIELSKKLFHTIGCQDFARFDYRVSNNKIYFIEANPLPALFRGGSFDALGQSMGLSYVNTLKMIIETSRKRLGI